MAQDTRKRDQGWGAGASLGQVMPHPGVLYQVSKLVQVQGGPCACRRHI